MAATNVIGDVKKMVRSNTGGVRNENYMLLSTTYPLNASDTKRMQVGLLATNEGTLEPALKLVGNTATGIHLDSDTWSKFKESMERASSYLSWMTKAIPEPIPINDIIINFTSAYGARAIMVSQRPKTSGENDEMAKTSSDSTQPKQPPTKKRRLFTVNIVMQKTSFEGLENIVKCIDAKYEQLHLVANRVNDCLRFLISEIELNLPNRYLDEDIVKQTLAAQYEEIEQNVRRQVGDVQFLDAHFNIIFCELTSIHLNEIVRTIIRNANTLI